MAEQIQKAIDAANLSDQIEVDFNAEYVQLNMSGAILFESGKTRGRKTFLPFVRAFVITGRISTSSARGM